jgi:3-hydroxyisobutyrate dehydrogenase-like beta-hydroxyacid dehydrogenase
MGAAMAGRLLDAGTPVTVWNRTRAKTAPLAARGARVVAEITGLGGCDIVFVMVAAPPDLEEVVCGPGGLLSGDPRPPLIVDCTTVSAAASARVRAAATAAGTEFQRARPYLDQIATVVVHAGEAEQSRLVKLCHNLYLGMMVQALAEVTSLAEKGGTDRAAFLEFLGGTVLGSEWVRERTGDLVTQDWTPTFTTELLRKDFDLGLGAARALEVPLPVGALVYQLIQSAIGAGHRDDDFLSLYDQQARGAALPPEE